MLWTLNKKLCILSSKIDTVLIYSVQRPSFKMSIHCLLYKTKPLLCREKLSYVIKISGHDDGGDKGSKQEEMGKWSYLYFIM